MTEQAEEVAFPIEEAIAYKGRDRVVHFTEYLSLKAAANHGRKIFSCGFPAFDKAVGGLAAGEVIVITGNAKEGKTTFAESWLMSMASSDADAKAFILSYEMPPEHLLEKWKFQPNAPVYLPMELETGNFDWIFKRCIEAKYKFNAKVVMIDHLGFVVDMATKNFSVNIGAFMRRLKTEVALKHGLAVILIAHQTQPKEGQEASMGTLYGSVTIGQDSDATIVVMRRENLTTAELQDFSEKAYVKTWNPGDTVGSEERAEAMIRAVKPPDDADLDDRFSAGLAVVKVDCHRRTGFRRWKKMFRKVGDWMVEI